MLLAEIIANRGKKFEATLQKFLTPEEPEMTPEEQAFLEAQAVQGQPQQGPPQGPPPDVTTVLSQLQQSGQTQGGAQTVSRV